MSRRELNHRRPHVDEYANNREDAIWSGVQPVLVDSPRLRDISICALREKYKSIRCRIGLALVAATLENRYISDRFLPTRPSTLVDEAASRMR